MSLSAIPTEPIGSIPRPLALIEAVRAHQAGSLTRDALDAMYDAATVDTIRRFEATGSPVISDGEQRKHDSFATYCVQGLPNFAPDGFTRWFVDHQRQFPRLTSGPFRYGRYADTFLRDALIHATVPVKQAVASPSALSLFYPACELPGYSRDAFIEDLLNEHETEMRHCLAQGAHVVQVDFTEARLAHRLDPTGRLLESFVTLNNMALNRFDADEVSRIGVHTCPGGDCDAAHSTDPTHGALNAASADTDFADLLPCLFELNAGCFYIALAREPDRPRALDIIRRHLKPDQRAFIGVIDPLSPRVETPDEVCDRVLEAARYIPLAQLGTTDDCGFAPFSDDTSTSRDTAFAKIEARVRGTAMAAERLARSGG
jgi:5-methyltetrahydropteroyltriglutamate--homocysteine methyltransferase